MPRIASEIVDVYVFRRRGKGAQYLLLRRSDHEVLPGTWQAVHGRIEPGERAVETAVRELHEETNLTPLALHQVDVVNTFYVARDDCVRHCPCFSAEVGSEAEPRLNDEHDAHEWVTFDEALTRFLWPGQRRAVREIEQEIVQRGPAVEYLRIALP